MKKFDNDINSSHPNIFSNKDKLFNKYKTTNINVLLNRVKLDKKKILVKRIYLILLLALIVSTLIFITIY